MNEQLPPRLLIVAALILLVTPCALVGLVGLFPAQTSDTDLMGILLPVIIVAQAAFLFWYYRRNRI